MGGVGARRFGQNPKKKIFSPFPYLDGCSGALINDNGRLEIAAAVI